MHLQFKGGYRATMKNVDHLKTDLKIALFPKEFPAHSVL